MTRRLPGPDGLPKDVGLHMIVARRTGGASRARYDPILGKLRELSAPVPNRNEPR
jgi:hypothetical protein